AHQAIDRIEGTVTDVVLDGDAGHTLSITESDGAERSLEATWILDATGRKRFLAKRLGLIVKPETGQRDCFWFRLRDFDRDLLKNINALGPMPPAEGEDYHYDRYFSTHHFMGRGNWIWLIPLRTPDDTELISIGITSRPDVYAHDVRSVEQFLEHVSAEHPVVTDLVRSGTVKDTSLLGNYRYISRQAYSPDRWCILGDAAHAIDPLFSNGLAFGTIQLEQIGEMISRDMAGELTPELVGQMDKAFWGPVIGSQNAITEWYESMHDPFLCSLRLNWIEIAYFYLLLPMVVNRCHFDPDRMGLWRILQNSATPFEVPQVLLAARKGFDTVTPDQFIYRGKEKVNRRALELVDDLGEIRSQIVAGSQLRQRYTADTLAQLEMSLAQLEKAQA
ncbi:MAG: tryptophan 7-halogenase, partial [Bacteroidetes bacterium]|nr:tryptophan 7-halogenase [Bacteroidota bacterium]